VVVIVLHNLHNTRGYYMLSELIGYSESPLEGSFISMLTSVEEKT